MKKYSEARCMKCPFLCMKRKSSPLVHHLPAADDDYLSLADRAEETASASKFFHNEYRRNPFILVWFLCVNYTNRTNNRVLNLDVIVVSIWLL